MIDKRALEAAQVLWDFHSASDPLDHADAIIGFGSYDIRVADRCAQLWHERLAPLIVFTGKAGNWTKGLYSTTEAAAFAARAMALGVPQNAIRLEEEATNLGDNVRFAARLLPTTYKAILVCKPQTQLRCQATAGKFWPSVLTMTTAPATNFWDQPIGHVDRHMLISELVGDLRRLELYPKLGFQVNVHIPKLAKSAASYLELAGYTDHLPDI